MKYHGKLIQVMSHRSNRRLFYVYKSIIRRRNDKVEYRDMVAMSHGFYKIILDHGVYKFIGNNDIFYTDAWRFDTWRAKQYINISTLILYD